MTTRTVEPAGQVRRVDTVVALDWFVATGPHGRVVTINRGEIVAADDPLVTMHPDRFAPSGLPAAAYAQLRADRAEARDLANQAYRDRLQSET